MRILKRNLAFVLALVMALSLTVSAMGVEDYSDVNEIAFVEAVDVMTEMGILEGTNGVFNPEKVLNRAEAAKIIAYMLLGKNAADNLQAVTAPFADVPAKHWAAGYIAHCVNEGIINGVSATEYNPNGELTATAFAKMLLSAVGYNVNGEFTGARWETEVNALALKLGVFDGNLGAELGAGCTREEAALYAFNTLMDIETVKYSELLGSYYTGNNAFDTASGTTLNEELYDYDTKADTDAFGRVGHVWLNAKNKVVTGLYADEADAVYTAEVKSGTIYADLGLSETVVADVIRNGKDAGTMQIKKNLTSTKIGGNGVLVEAYVDEDDNVTLVVIDTYLAKVEADAEDGEVDVTVYFGKDNITSKTFETAVEYAKDEWVLVTYADNAIQTMVPAEVVAGELTAYAAKYIKIDGEKLNKAANLVEDATNFEVVYDVQMNALVDEYGYVLGLVNVEEAEESIGYVYVTASQAQASDLLIGEAAVVKVMYMDGTGYEVLPMATKTVAGKTQIQMGNNKALTYTNLKECTPVETGFYGYYMNDDEQIVLMPLTATQEIEIKEGWSDKIVSDGKKQALAFGTYNVSMNSNTVLNIVTDENVTTYEGYKNINLNETGVNALMVLNAKGGKIVTELYIIDGSVVESDVYAYYNGESYSTTKGTWVTMYVDGGVESYLQGDVKLSDGIYKIEVEDDTLVKADLVAAEAENVVAAAKTLYFTVGKTNHYYADDVKIYDVTDGGEVASVAKNDKVVFVTENNLVTYIYIIGESTTPVEEDKINPVEGIEATAVKVDGGIKVSVSGNTEKKPVMVEIYKYVNGVYGLYDTVTWEPSFVDGWANTVEVSATDVALTATVYVGGELVDTFGPFAF